jgi:hypothetical protein
VEDTSLNIVRDLQGTSSSRTYVVYCITNLGEQGFGYFYKFKLPEGMKNQTDTAAWFFLTYVLSGGAGVVSKCLPYEDYADLREDKEATEEAGQRWKQDYLEEEVMLPSRVRASLLDMELNEGFYKGEV